MRCLVARLVALFEEAPRFDSAVAAFDEGLIARRVVAFLWALVVARPGAFLFGSCLGGRMRSGDCIVSRLGERPLQAQFRGQLLGLRDQQRTLNVFDLRLRWRAGFALSYCLLEPCLFRGPLVAVQEQASDKYADAGAYRDFDRAGGVGCHL